MQDQDSLRFDGVRVMLIDDEPNLLRVVRRILHRRGAEVESAGDGQEALAKIESFEPDIILTDLMMPTMDGLELLDRLRDRELSPVVVVLTGHGTMETAIDAMRLGARDYLLKPCDPDEILLVFHRELEAQRLRQENGRLQRAVSSLSDRLDRYEGFGEMIGASAPMQELYDQIGRLCRFHDLTVLITGETGTGKELVARALHKGSPRGSYPFIAINCAAIPDDLQESQLFGHRKGAFTGATEDAVGAFEAASRGTLLLDEIGEMRLEMQAKLLRALEDHKITPLGKHQPLQIDVRVVASTNCDLAAAVAAGEFRADLYNRLAGAVLQLPPLRERPEDIAPLAAHFLARFAADYNVPPKQLDPAALARLESYGWPGNVRELQNVIRRAYVFSDGEVIGADQLELEFTRLAASVAAPVPVRTGDGTLEEQERILIEQALNEAGGNKSRAAEMLGIDRKRLYRRLKKYGME